MRSLGITLIESYPTR